MASNIFFRPHSLSISIFSPTTSFFRKPTFLSLFSAAPQILTQSQTLPYGPSLLKGQIPQIYQSPSKIPIRFEEDDEQEDFKDLDDEEEENVLDKAKFTRVFDIAALRVPSNYCFSLESRLRGHLLNWPRVRNIARVPGDEVGADVVKLIGAYRKKNNNYEDNVENLNSLNRRIYGMAEGDGEKLGPVLYREKLVKEFNSRGFEKFRNLAKLSRPKNKKNKKKSEEEKVQNVKGESGRRKLAAVEVVEEEEENGEDLRGLLGNEFKGRRWRGSTRLLLLDERYVDRGLDELPEAIKAVFKEGTGGGTTLSFELVKCKLTLFYDYWQMNEILEALLPKDMIVPSAFEIVGHIAHLNLRDEHLPYKKVIAKVVLDKNKPKIQTVVNKIEAIHNDYRTMQLEVLAGNHSLLTTIVENGIRFHVDLAAVYWNSRLGTERQRLLNGFKRSDVVCDVFAGVGPIAISAAMIVKRVYANDLNPHAIEYLEKNSVLNKLEKKIEVFNMDGRRFINAIFAGEKVHSITQVVMNLPNDAAEYLDAFRGIFRNRPKDREFTLPMIHVYGFSKARDPEFDFHERIRIALSEVAVDVKMRKVRLVAPGKWMLCASFILPESVAFAKTIFSSRSTSSTRESFRILPSCTRGVR